MFVLVDRRVLADLTNRVEYVAAPSCLSCLSATAYNPHSKDQNATYTWVLADPTYNPLQLSQVSCKQQKRMCQQISKQLCSELRVFCYMWPEKQFSQQWTHRGGRALLMTELGVPQTCLVQVYFWGS